MNILEKFKLHLGITDDSQDGLLIMLLDNARLWIAAYTGREDWTEETPEKVHGFLLIVAASMYNARGTEGAENVGEGGVTWSANMLPRYIERGLNRFRAARVVDMYAYTT